MTCRDINCTASETNLESPEDFNNFYIVQHKTEQKSIKLFSDYRVAVVAAAFASFTFTAHWFWCSWSHFFLALDWHTQLATHLIIWWNMAQLGRIQQTHKNARCSWKNWFCFLRNLKTMTNEILQFRFCFSFFFQPSTLLRFCSSIDNLLMQFFRSPTKIAQRRRSSAAIFHATVYLSMTNKREKIEFLRVSLKIQNIDKKVQWWGEFQIATVDNMQNWDKSIRTRWSVFTWNWTDAISLFMHFLLLFCDFSPFSYRLVCLFNFDVSRIWDLRRTFHDISSLCVIPYRTPGKNQFQCLMNLFD